jgi:ComF family protein
MLRAIAASVGQLLVPALCAACGDAAGEGGRFPLCRACGEAMAALIQAPYCPRCGRHSGPGTFDEQGCLFCRLYPIHHDATVRVGAYEHPLKSLILRYKNQRRQELASVLGRLLSERLAVAPWGDLVEEIIPVPLHWTRRVRRGFNQSQEVARVLASAVDRPLRQRLRRIRRTEHQSRLAASERRKAVRGAFQIRGRDAAPLKDRTVLVVDDVMTSGTTMAECVRILKKAGVRAVYVAVISTADYDEPGPW